MFITKRLIFIILCLCPLWAWAAECPDGYGIIDDSGLCKVECPSGYRVVNAGETCTKITGTTPYYSAQHTVTYGETSGDNVKKCPEPDPSIISNISGNVFVPPSVVHDSINFCIATITNVRYATEDGDGLNTVSHGTMRAPCYYLTGDDGHAIYGKGSKDPVTGKVRYGCVGGSTVISCDAGFYAKCTSIGNASPDNLGCDPVGYNYYSPDGDLSRYPCPDGTMTCGYGDCADSIDDCVPYKTLHIGENNTLVMGTVKYISPSLAVRDGNTVYYAQSTTANISTPHLRFMGDDGVKHTLINPLEQFTTTVRSRDATYAPYCENGETTYTHINIP